MVVGAPVACAAVVASADIDVPEQNCKIHQIYSYACIHEYFLLWLFQTGAGHMID